MKHSMKSSGAVLRLCLLVFAGLLFTACDNKKTPTVNYQEIEAARTAMVNWLECEECTEGELKAVLVHSKRLQPMFMSTLKKGVAPASTELYRLELEKRYDELVAYSEKHPRSKPTLPKEKFVQLYLDKLTAQYQSRAAKALAAIGGEESKRALQEALQTTRAEDVKMTIKQALEEAK
ncbi:MAG: HEAT repeat domain-containing protein [Gammaproteobacteria bacterium]|nr:HEAT repeat domain-containing protein [Gammaproteobacteria bacterium]MDH5653220.1 HEAT repeat domain-containing protein [Gammaproteobacteria bacterium]